MADNFQGVKKITLQPGDATVPYTFTLAACSSATANDGSIPYNTTVDSAVIKVFDEAGVDKTTEFISSESNSTTTLTINLKYPATAGVGRYSIEMLVTLTGGGAVMEFDFTRLYAKDITA
jgi:hypothetical protein